MSNEQLKSLRAAILADAGLQKKLEGITDPARISEIAIEAGFQVTPDDLTQGETEISEADLDDISGGRRDVRVPPLA